MIETKADKAASTTRTFDLKENLEKLQAYAQREHHGNNTAAIRKILRDAFAAMDKEQSK